MYEEKHISETEARSKLTDWVRNVDSSSLCTLLEYAFGVMSRKTDTTGITLSPGSQYQQAFGEFEEFAEPNLKSCKCKEENWKYFSKGSCICGKETAHMHCKSCGGFIAGYMEEDSFVILLPRLFGREIMYPVEILEKKISEGTQKIILDATETVFMDSSAIRSLIKISKDICVVNGSLSIRNLRTNLFNQFKAVNLDKVFNIKGENIGQEKIGEEKEAS